MPSCQLILRSKLIKSADLGPSSTYVVQLSLQLYDPFSIKLSFFFSFPLLVVQILGLLKYLKYFGVGI